MLVQRPQPGELVHLLVRLAFRDVHHLIHVCSRVLQHITMLEPTCHYATYFSHATPSHPLQKTALRILVFWERRCRSIPSGGHSEASAVNQHAHIVRGVFGGPDFALGQPHTQDPWQSAVTDPLFLWIYGDPDRDSNHDFAAMDWPRNRNRFGYISLGKGLLPLWLGCSDSVRTTTHP